MTNSIQSLEGLISLLGEPSTLVPCAGKRPVDAAWQKFTPTNNAQHDFQKYNVGVICGEVSGNLVTLDFDVDEVAQEFATLNSKLWFNSLRIRGSKGEKLLLRLKNKDGVRNQKLWKGGVKVGEFQFNGSQTIVHGIHPITKSPYEITNTAEILTVESLAEVVFPPDVMLTDQRAERPVKGKARTGVVAQYCEGGSQEYDNAVCSAVQQMRARGYSNLEITAKVGVSLGYIARLEANKAYDILHPSIQNDNDEVPKYIGQLSAHRIKRQRSMKNCTHRWWSYQACRDKGISTNEAILEDCLTNPRFSKLLNSITKSKNGSTTAVRKFLMNDISNQEKAYGDKTEVDLVDKNKVSAIEEFLQANPMDGFSTSELHAALGGKYSYFIVARALPCIDSLECRGERRWARWYQKGSTKEAELSELTKTISSTILANNLTEFTSAQVMELLTDKPSRELVSRSLNKIDWIEPLLNTRGGFYRLKANSPIAAEASEVRAAHEAMANKVSFTKEEGNELRATIIDLERHTDDYIPDYTNPARYPVEYLSSHKSLTHKWSPWLEKNKVAKRIGGKLIPCIRLWANKTIKDLLPKFVITVIHGGPGTGKTFDCAELMNKAKAEGKKVTYMVPTHELRERLTKKLEHKCETVEGALSIPVEDETTTSNDWKFFKEPRKAKSVADCYVFDEAGMLDVYKLAKALLRISEAADSTKKFSATPHLIFVGDVAQIPSAHGHALRDIINHAKKNIPGLTSVHKTENVRSNEDIQRSLKAVLAQDYDALVAASKEGSAFELVITKNSQETLDATARLAKKNKCMAMACLKSNDYGAGYIASKIRGRDLMEGDTIVIGITDHERRLVSGERAVFNKWIEVVGSARSKFNVGTKRHMAMVTKKDGDVVYVEKENVAFPECLTIARMQGGEEPVMIMALQSFVGLSLEILYTALSRAKEKAILVTTETALRHALKHHTERKTLLLA